MMYEHSRWCVIIYITMSGDDSDTAPRTLKTVLKSIEVIDALITLEGAGVTELAHHLDMSKSTAYTYLKTLERGELVTKNDNEYRLSYNFLVAGEYVRNRSLLYQVGKDEIDELAAETGHYAHLVIEENGRGINLYKAKGEEAIGDDYQAAKFQQRDYLHITASGKAILAYLPRDRVETIIDQYGLPARTNQTITDKDHLLEHLSDIRERGFAYNNEEEIEGFRAVGAPITQRNGEVLGSVSMSGPTSVLKGESFYEDLTELVTKTANIIEVNINMSNRSSEIIDTG